MDVFLATLFAIGFGIGLSYLISATKLFNENMVGDDIAEMRHYCSEIKMTIKSEPGTGKLAIAQLEEPKVQLAPKGTAPVEKPKEWTDNTSPMLEDPERTYKPEPPRKRDNPSSFPRSFHDV